MLSNFHALLAQDGKDFIDQKTHVLALEKIVSLGQKVFQNQIQGSLDLVPLRIRKLMYEIVEAARVVILNNFEPCSELVQFLKSIVTATLTRSFGDATLRCACNELLSILSTCPELSEINIKSNDSSENLDFTLSFMDNFVSDHLEKGGAPYKALPAKPGSRASVLLALELERNHGDSELCNSNLVVADCSLGSSVLSLAGTESARNVAGSVSSVSSEESKCWTFSR